MSSTSGDTQVHGPGQLAVWVRKRDDGFARSIAARPKVTLAYYGPGGPSPFFLSIRGHARLDESANDAVYSSMIDGEKGQDPDRHGVRLATSFSPVSRRGA